MKTASCRGNALLIALIMVVVVSGFVGVAYTTTDHAARSADRSRDSAGAQAAADGAVEYAFAAWRSAIAAASTTTAAITLSASVPSFSGYSRVGDLLVVPCDEYGVPTSTAAGPPSIATDIAGYRGWQGRTFNYIARAQYTSGYDDLRIGVRRQFQYAEVPLFQAMYFFEHDFEIYKPAEMIVGGLVHSNSNMWVSGHSGGSLTFQGNVSHAGSYSASPAPYGPSWSAPSGTSAPIYPGGQSNQLSQVARMEPLGEAPAQVLNATDTNPNNDTFRELIEPPNLSFSDPTEIATRRLYNKAGMRVNINGGTITVTGANGLTLSPAKQTEIRSAISASATIYDQREGRNVDVRSLDVAVLRTALSTGVSGFNGVLYIHDVTPQVTGNLEPKTIRLRNGGTLPDAGLTVVSENPIYIHGDYNTGSTAATINNVPSNSGGNPSNTDSPTVSGYTRKPSAVIGDAVMLLSNNWSDANSSSSLSSRPATHTTYNTAIISGFMPSGYQPPVGAQYGYSGGANNFPRFLENWGGDHCTYYGSMVELFQSTRFTGRWDTGVIYRPPARRWNYDTNFTNNPPPGAVTGTTWSRGTWAKW
jgi:hypothetical protein